jgi:hypothetical protein
MVRAVKFRTLLMNIVITTLLLVLAAGCRAESRVEAPRAASALAALTGARARVVWVRDLASGDDMFLKGNQHQLMGLDSVDGRERVLWAPGDQINKPLLSPDGRYVVCSRFRDDRLFRLDWTGGPPREIGSGYALDVWRDPASGRDWVYAAVDRSQNRDAPYQRIVRFPLDAPDAREEVWSNGDVSMDNVDLSRDGRRLGGMFPWPRGLVVDTATRRATALGRGCWSSLAPDNSYLLWVFEGTHRHLFFHTADGRHRWRATINTIPGGDNRRMYHPRWSNHARFFVTTGPYDTDALGKKKKGTGRGVELWVGRFRDDLRAVEAWARVTENNEGDFFPDLWVEGGDQSHVPAAALPASDPADVPPPTLGDVWPGSEDGLVYRWAHGNTRNEVLHPATGQRVECAPEARGGARHTRDFGMDIRGGYFSDNAAAERLLATLSATNELTLELTVTPRRDDFKGPARILAFSRGVGHANFILGQEGRQLVLRLRTPETGRDGSANDSQVTLGPVPPGRPTHVLVSYRPGHLTAYLQGQPVEAPQKIQGDFSTWSDADFTIGAEPGGERGWDGEVEGLAVYGRFVGAAEARRHYDLYAGVLAARAPVETLRVRAKVVEATPAPDADSVAPYRRALALYVYELDPAAPAVDGSRRIQVYQWALLDGRPVEGLPQPGAWRDLVLERSEARPELESERRVVGTESFDLPEFLDVSR